jgi:hypothetical protein
MTTYAAARLRCPAHNGVAQDIRDALKRCDGPMSAYRLSFECGRKYEQVTRALAALVRIGGVVAVHGPKYTVYKLYEPPKPGRTASGGLQKAGIITIGRGSRWGAGRA